MAGLVLERLCVAGAILLTIAGIAAAWASTHAVKRVVGALTAQIGAALALAALGLFDAATAGVAVALGVLLLGVALLVRLQEAYGSVEIADIEAADADADADLQGPRG